MASRRIEDLDRDVAELARRHQLACLERGLELLIYCTLRDEVEQARLFSQGRTADQLHSRCDRFTQRGLTKLATLLASIKPDPTARKVTNAGPGESFHQYGLAYDCVPMVEGKAMWGTTGAGAALWKTVAEAGESVGLEWAGRWRTFREMPHFQATGGRSIETLMEERYGSAVPAMATAAAPGAAAADEAQAVADALAEANTVLLVLTSMPGVPGAQLQAAISLAKRVVNINPAVWRCLHVCNAAALRPDQALSLWGQTSPTPAVTLGLAVGTQRRRTTYTLAQLNSPAKVYDAYATA